MHLYKVSEFGLLNLYTILIARNFGPVGSTPFILYTSIGTTLSLIGAFAVDGVLLRYLPKMSDADGVSTDTFLPGVSNLQSFIKKLFAFRLFVVSVIITLLLLAVLLSRTFDSSASTMDDVIGLVPYLCVFLFAQAIIAFSTFSLIGLLRTKAVFFTSLISRAALLLSVLLVFALDTYSIETVILLHCGSAILNALLILLSLHRSLSVSVTDKKLSIPNSIASSLRELYSFFRRPSSVKSLVLTPIMLYGLLMWSNDVLGLILGRQSDILMLRAIFGDKTAEVGYYNVSFLALMFTEYVFLLSSGGLITIFSKLAHVDERATDGASVDYSNLNKGRKEAAGFQSMIILPLSVFVFTFALSILRVCFGPLYDVSAVMVQQGIIALGINIAIFQAGVQSTSLLAIGKQRLVVRNRIYFALINIVLNYFLITSYGALGAIIGTSWINVLACATEWYFARKYVGAIINVWLTLKIIVLSVVAGVACLEIGKLLWADTHSVEKLIIMVAIFSLLIYTLFHVFRIKQNYKGYLTLK